MVRELGDEPAVDINEAHEGLHLFLVRGRWPICYACDFDGVHLDMIERDDDSEIFDPLLLELALLHAKVELVLVEEFEYES